MNQKIFTAIVILSFFLPHLSAADCSRQPVQSEIPAPLAEKLLNKTLKAYQDRFGPDYKSVPMYQLMESDVAKHRNDPSYFFDTTAADLNGDGKPEWLIHENLCHTHNCPVWVYGQKGKSFEVLLGGLEAADMSRPAVLNVSTRGYCDIKIMEEESAAEMEEIIYKFDGRSYRPAKCATITYADDGADERQKKAKAHKCKKSR